MPRFQNSHELCSLLQRGKPHSFSLLVSQRGVRAVVVPDVPCLHFFFEFIVCLKGHCFVKTLSVGSVGSLYFPVMPRRVRSDELMFNSQFSEQLVQNVNFFAVLSVCELAAVVCLNNMREVAEVHKGSLYKVLCCPRRQLIIRVEKALSGSLVNHRVLIKTSIA